MSPVLWRWLRRLSQLVFSAGVIWLVARTTYPLTAGFPYDIIPRFSPLLGVTTALAARAFVPATLLALAVVALTLTLGRAFCGWVCPLGVAFDACDWLWARLSGKRYRRETASVKHRAWRFVLLITVIAAAAFGLNVAGWLDPLSAWPRFLGVSAIPYANVAADAATRALYDVPPLRETVAAARQWLIRENVTIMPGHVAVTAFVVALAALGLVKRRFYCRYVCPTGAALAVIGWASPFGRRVRPGECRECRRCRNVCRMGAIGGDGEATVMAECTLCLDCLVLKNCAVTSFGFGRARPPGNPTSWAPALSRRGFLGAAAASAAAGAGAWALERNGTPSAYVVRPPGGQDEDDFLARCVRCGECIRVCLTQGLVPAYFEAGPTGLWTPRFDMRKGYCEYRCTLCTDVCPSDALPPLTEAAKKKTVLGVAVINRRLCLPWAKDEECIVCEEMCPTAPKAIGLKGQGLLKPYVVPDECVGCGICEFACPVEGVSAIRVVNPASSPYARGKGSAAAGGGQRRRHRGAGR